MNKAVAKSKILNSIEKNISNYQFSVIRLADEMGISYSYLYEIVNDQFGMSPLQLIETLKMERALRMVGNGIKMIKIYKRLGYGDIRSFREAFCKRLQMNYSTCRANLEKCTGLKREAEIKKYVSTLWQYGDI